MPTAAASKANNNNNNSQHNNKNNHKIAAKSAAALMALRSATIGYANGAFFVQQCGLTSGGNMANEGTADTEEEEGEDESDAATKTDAEMTANDGRRSTAVGMKINTAAIVHHPPCNIAVNANVNDGEANVHLHDSRIMNAVTSAADSCRGSNNKHIKKNEQFEENRIDAVDMMVAVSVENIEMDRDRDRNRDDGDDVDLQDDGEASSASGCSSSMETLSDNVSIWMDGERRWIAGVDEHTTCADLILALVNYQQDIQSSSRPNTGAPSTTTTTPATPEMPANCSINQMTAGGASIPIQGPKSTTTTNMAIATAMKRTKEATVADRNTTTPNHNSSQKQHEELLPGKLSSAVHPPSASIATAMVTSTATAAATVAPTPSPNTPLMHLTPAIAARLLCEYVIVKQHRHCEEYLDGSTRVFDVLPGKVEAEGGGDEGTKAGPADGAGGRGGTTNICDGQKECCQLLLRRLAPPSSSTGNHHPQAPAAALITDKDSGMGSPVGSSSRSAAYRLRRRRQHRHHKAANWLALGKTAHPKRIRGLEGGNGEYQTHENGTILEQNVDERVAHERLMKIILAQDETIHRQLTLLREKERQIAKIEVEKHRKRERELGKNYLLETYLNGLDEAEELASGMGGGAGMSDLVDETTPGGMQMLTDRFEEIFIDEPCPLSPDTGGGKRREDRKKASRKHKQHRSTTSKTILSTKEPISRRTDRVTSPTTHLEQGEEGERAVIEDKDIGEQLEWLEKVHAINKRLHREEETLLKLHSRLRRHTTKRAHQMRTDVLGQIGRVDTQLARKCADLRHVEDTLHASGMELQHKLAMLEQLHTEMVGGTEQEANEVDDGKMATTASEEAPQIGATTQTLWAMGNQRQHYLPHTRPMSPPTTNTITTKTTTTTAATESGKSVASAIPVQAPPAVAPPTVTVPTTPLATPTSTAATATTTTAMKLNNSYSPAELLDLRRSISKPQTESSKLPLHLPTSATATTTATVSLDLNDEMARTTTTPTTTTTRTSVVATAGVSLLSSIGGGAGGSANNNDMPHQAAMPPGDQKQQHQQKQQQMPHHQSFVESCNNNSTRDSNNINIGVFSNINNSNNNSNNNNNFNNNNNNYNNSKSACKYIGPSIVERQLLLQQQHQVQLPASAALPMPLPLPLPAPLPLSTTMKQHNISDKNVLVHTKTLAKQMFGPKSLNQMPAVAATVTATPASTVAVTVAAAMLRPSMLPANCIDSNNTSHNSYNNNNSIGNALASNHVNQNNNNNNNNMSCKNSCNNNNNNMPVNDNNSKFVAGMPQPPPQLLQQTGSVGISGVGGFVGAVCDSTSSSGSRILLADVTAKCPLDLGIVARTRGGCVAVDLSQMGTLV